MSEKRFFAYIDETGDLGDLIKSPSSIPHFGMAAVIFEESAGAALRELIDWYRAEFNIPKEKNVSWKEHVRDHDRRLLVADRLVALEGVTVSYVYTDKATVVGEYVRERGFLYNYVAGKMLKNVLYAARNMGATDGSLTIRYSHVHKFDHEGLSRPYLTERLPSIATIPLNLVESINWVNARKYRESDVADLFAGCLLSALVPGKYGHVEGRYLRTVWPRVRGVENCGDPDSQWCALPLGFMPMPTYSVADQDWFPCRPCKRMPVNTEGAG